MIKIKPQTVLVSVIAENVDATTKIVKVPNFGAAISVDVQLTPNAKGVIYTRTGLDLNNPHTIYCEPKDAKFLTVGTRVLWNDRAFTVSSPAEYFVIGAAADHASCLLEELTVTP